MEVRSEPRRPRRSEWQTSLYSFQRSLNYVDESGREISARALRICTGPVHHKTKSDRSCADNHPTRIRERVEISHITHVGHRLGAAALAIAYGIVREKCVAEVDAFEFR